MTRNELKDMIRGLYSYFRLNDPSTKEQMDLWAADLQYIDAAAIPFITGQMRDFDNLPRNLPKAIKYFYTQYRRVHTSFVKYDAVEDMRYPIGKLHDATEILLTKGDSEFGQYCRTHYMPSQDVERCRNKANRIRQQSIAQLPG